MRMRSSLGSIVSPALPKDPPQALTPPGITLPADHYAHPGAPTEWWWNIGTLNATDGSGRVFGFEVNIASYAGQGGYAFTQIMLTDVSAKRHLQRTTLYLAGVFNCADWAQCNPARDWYVQLGSPTNFLSTIEVTNGGANYSTPPEVVISGGGGSDASATATLDALGHVKTVELWDAGKSPYTSAPTISFKSLDGGAGATAQALQTYAVMNAPQANPLQNITLDALLVDAGTQAPVRFQLTMSQPPGPPFLVLGTGKIPVPKTCGTDLQTNNFYYSLTQLANTGTITYDGETIPVSGITWMDHEYGAFAAAGKPVKWILQDMQLDNGVCISNFSLTPPVEGQATQSIATVQYPGQPSIWVLTTMRPSHPWTSEVTGKTYYMTFVVQMHPLVPWWPEATLTVTSLVRQQEFPSQEGAIYEGVAKVEGSWNGLPVSGTAWNEQAPH